VIPLSSSRARISLSGIKNEFKQFTEFVKRFSPSNLHAATETIPTEMHNYTYDAGHMNTGDATGLSKPISGGGIYTSVRSVYHAMRWIHCHRCL
jgi:flavin-dependent dehydrogenase